jgi:hypothetical protein
MHIKQKIRGTVIQCNLLRPFVKYALYMSLLLITLLDSS